MPELKKIISGGQTGADQGGLEAAERLKIATGGTMPKGFRTEVGPMPELAARFGLEALVSAEYPPRTRYNIVGSDGTIIFGSVEEPGSGLTKKMCKESHKPFLVIEEFDERDAEMIVKFIGKYGIQVLNIAGNRESGRPGIQKRVRDFLVEALKDAN
jgi:hypothetical protein